MTDFPGPERDAPEVAGEARPVFGAVQRSTGTRDKVKTPGSIRTSWRSGQLRADIASIEEPHARKRESFIDEAADKALENRVEGSLLGNLSRSRCSDGRPHDGKIIVHVVVTQRYFVYIEISSMRYLM